MCFLKYQSPKWHRATTRRSTLSSSILENSFLSLLHFQFRHLDCKPWKRCKQRKQNIPWPGWHKVPKWRRVFINSKDPKHTLFCRKTAFVPTYALFKGQYSHSFLAVQINLLPLLNHQNIQKIFSIDKMYLLKHVHYSLNWSTTGKTDWP